MSTEFENKNVNYAMQGDYYLPCIKTKEQPEERIVSAMQINKFSAKQREILDFIVSDGYAIICDGTVRSGKTVVSRHAAGYRKINQNR